MELSVVKTAQLAHAED